jgi:predicted nucleotidyltransferase
MLSLGDLLKKLIDADIDFVLIGGYAGVVHGSTMVTRDLDICALVTPEQIGKLRECFKEFHPTHRMTPKRLSFLNFPEELQGIKNIYLETDLGVLDIISEVTGVGDFTRLASQAIGIELYGRQCKVISIEDLILAKEAMGRDKDKAIVKELKAIQDSIKKS